MSKRDKKDVCFFTVVEGQPKRRIWITAENHSPPHVPETYVQGWQIVCDEMDENGGWQPYRDSWEETFERILLYPETYAPKTTHWIDLNTAKPVNIYELEFEE